MDCELVLAATHSGGFAPPFAKSGRQRPSTESQNPPVEGLLGITGGKVSERRTAWLATQC
jgi:hypothetical protein